MELLSRNDFRTGVFARDGHRCVICGKSAVDAHHILERRLWHDGGYYLANGVSVCESHHLAAEATTLSCDELRQAAGIVEVLLPEHLYPDQPYDKWGNPILPNGQRLKGELFFDESVQKIIEPVRHLFTNRVKHPRTYHLPWSPGISSDDRVMEDLSGFEGQEIVITVKMDGEQTSMYRDGFHARSIDTPAHPSRDWLWKVHRKVAHDIPEGWRICGENLYAVHSIRYKNLRDHFLVYAVWNDRNVCLSWGETEEWVRLLDLQPVPLIAYGKWEESYVRELVPRDPDGDDCEGYVVRVQRPFGFGEFRRVVGKYVRKGHVRTHGHWMRQAVEVNGLAQK